MTLVRSRIVRFTVVPRSADHLKACRTTSPYRTSYQAKRLLASNLHAVECPCLHPGEEVMPLVTTQSDRRASRIGGATDHDSVTDCRNFDTRAAFARQTFVPYRFASQSVTHTTPKCRWVMLSAPSETRGLNLCQTKDLLMCHMCAMGPVIQKCRP